MLITMEINKPSIRLMTTLIQLGLTSSGSDNLLASFNPKSMMMETSEKKENIRIKLLRDVVFIPRVYGFYVNAFF